MIVVLRTDYDAVRFTTVCAAPRTNWTSESGTHSTDSVASSTAFPITSSADLWFISQMLETRECDAKSDLHLRV